MIGLFRAVVRTIFGNRSTQYHYECRDCGRNLDSSSEDCPECGGEVVVYQI